MNLKSFLIVVFIIIVLMITGCFSDDKKESGKIDTRQIDVTIGYSALRISLPIFVAYENGYFEQEGLNVKLERFETAQPLMEALVSGEVHIAGYTALPITFNCMLKSHKELYFVTAMMEDQDHLVSYFLIPADAAEDVQISNFKGKKIGILPTVAYKVWLKILLNESGVNPEDVKIIPISPLIETDALRTGEIDALFTNDPTATIAIKDGIARKISDEALVPKYLGQPFIFGSFNIDKIFADNNPEIAEKVVSAIDKAVQFVNENHVQAKQAMKKFIHGHSKAYVEFYPDAFYKKTTEVIGEDFQKMSDQYFETGMIPSKLSVKNLSFRTNKRE